MAKPRSLTSGKIPVECVGQRRLAYKRVALAAAATLLLSGAVYGISKGAGQAYHWATNRGPLATKPSTGVTKNADGQCQTSGEEQGSRLLASLGVPCGATCLTADKAKLEAVALQLENMFSSKGDYQCPASISGVRVEPTSEGFNLVSPVGTYSSLSGWQGDFSSLIQASPKSSAEAQSKGEISRSVLQSGWKMLSGLDLPDFVESAQLEHDSGQRAGHLKVRCQGKHWSSLFNQMSVIRHPKQQVQAKVVSALWGAIPASGQRMIVPGALLSEFLSNPKTDFGLARLIRIHRDGLVALAVESPIPVGQSAATIQRAIRLDLPLSLVVPPGPQASSIWGSTPLESVESSDCQRVDFGELLPGPGKAAARPFGPEESGWGNFVFQGSEQLSCEWAMRVSPQGLDIDYRFQASTPSIDDPCLASGPDRESQHRTKPNLWANK